MFSQPPGQPGLTSTSRAAPREVFAANRGFAQFVAGPVTIDGHASGNPLNDPDTALLFAGTLMGRLGGGNGVGRYAPATLGLTTAPYVKTGAASTTVLTDPATAAELVRRVGPTGTLKLTGPATPGGPVTVQTFGYAAVNAATGVVTLAAGGSADAITGSLLQPNDGADRVVAILCDAWGVRVADAAGTRADGVQAGLLLAAGGTVDVDAIVHYPPDPALRAWVKAAVRATCPGVTFSDDFT